MNASPQSVMSKVELSRGRTGDRDRVRMTNNECFSTPFEEEQAAGITRAGK